MTTGKYQIRKRGKREMGERRERSENEELTKWFYHNYVTL